VERRRYRYAWGVMADSTTNISERCPFCGYQGGAHNVACVAGMIGISDWIMANACSAKETTDKDGEQEPQPE